MSKEEAIEVLNMFNVNAQKLRNSKFVRWTETNSLKVHMPINPAIVKKNSFPDDEEIEAFVLTFRKFIQNNDNSIANLSKIYAAFPLSADLKNAFNSSRTNLNDYLDSRCGCIVKGVPELVKLTSRDLMNIYIFGWLSHNNKEKYKKYKSIEEDGFLRDFLWLEFILVLHTVFTAIYHFMHFNKLAIEELNELP